MNIKILLRLVFIGLFTGLVYLFLMVPHWISQLFPEKSLTMYVWSGKIDESVFKKFEEKTGIKVYVSYYESNEELLTKLDMMAHVDCDIMVPSGYSIERLKQLQLIKKIDKTKCPFIGQLYPELLHTVFDPHNDYGIPLYWDVLGIGYDSRKVFQDKDQSDISWRDIFESIPCARIGMIDDAREALFLTMLYFGFDLKKGVNKEQLKQMRRLLIDQKRRVGAYSDSQQGYFLASETFPLVVSQRENIIRDKQELDYIKFAIPKEGSLLTIDYMVMSASTEKDDLVYKLLEYLYSEEVLLHNCKEYRLLPAHKEVFKKLSFDTIGIHNIEPGQKEFEKLVIFKNLLTQKEINDFWIRFKAS